MQNNLEAYFNPTHNAVRIPGVVFEKIIILKFHQIFVKLEKKIVKFHFVQNSICIWNSPCKSNKIEFYSNFTIISQKLRI